MADKVERIPSNPSNPSDPSIGGIREEKTPYEINNVLTMDEGAVERLVTSLGHQVVANI